MKPCSKVVLMKSSPCGEMWTFKMSRPVDTKISSLTFYVRAKKNTQKKQQFLNSFTAETPINIFTLLGGKQNTSFTEIHVNYNFILSWPSKQVSGCCCNCTEWAPPSWLSRTVLYYKTMSVRDHVCVSAEQLCPPARTNHSYTIQG